MNTSQGKTIAKSYYFAAYGTAFIVFIPTLRFLPNVSYLKIPKKSQDHLYQ